MGGKNPWADWPLIFLGSKCPRRNHVFQIWWRSVKGFSVGWGSNFAISHWLWRSSLQHSHTTVWACDRSNLLKERCDCTTILPYEITFISLAALISYFCISVYLIFLCPSLHFRFPTAFYRNDLLFRTRPMQAVVTGCVCQSWIKKLLTSFFATNTNRFIRYNSAYKSISICCNINISVNCLLYMYLRTLCAMFVFQVYLVRQSDPVNSRT